MEEGVERFKDQKDQEVCCETMSPIHNREGTAILEEGTSTEWLPKDSNNHKSNTNRLDNKKGGNIRGLTLILNPVDSELQAANDC